MKLRVTHILFTIFILFSLGYIFQQASVNQQIKDLNESLTVKTKTLIEQAESNQLLTIQYAAKAVESEAESGALFAALEKERFKCKGQ